MHLELSSKLQTETLGCYQLLDSDCTCSRALPAIGLQHILPTNFRIAFFQSG